MAKFLFLLIALALVMTNSIAIAAAKCQHLDAQSHMSALKSSDGGVAVVAVAEEAAALAATKKAALADAAAAQLTVLLVPTSPIVPYLTRDRMTAGPEPQVTKPASLAVKPLLEPPSA